METRARSALAPALAAALALPVLAGCIAAPQPLGPAEAAADGVAAMLAKLTQPIYDTIVYERLAFRSFDDTLLGIELYRPEAPAEVKLPTLLVMTPYQGEEDLFRTPYFRPLHDYFAPRGYAVAFGDVRGTHNAGGCLEQTDSQQARDGYEMVEFLASQPWSNGKVGMFGISYDGETQQSTATLAPPSLVTIVPAASVSNQYLWFYQNGVPYRAQWVGMTSYMAIGLTPGHTPEALASYPERVPCHVRNHQESMEPFHDGRMDAYWDDRNWQPHVKNITASVLYIHGLQDWNVKPIHILDWYNEIPTPKRAILGQWWHTYPTREDFTLLVHRWYDHWLLGIDTGIMDEDPVMIQDSLGRWRLEDSFPALDAAPWTLHLRRDALNFHNRLSPAAPPGDEPPQGYLDRPLGQASAPGTFVPFVGGVNPAGAPPRLVYVTETLQERVHYSGAPEVRLFVSVSEGSTHLAAHLLDVAPDGSMKLVNRGYMDTRFRDSLHEPSEMGPEEVAELRFTMNPQDTVFEPGHRIGLAVMSLDEFIEQDPSGSRVTVHHDAERPSSVTLPLVFPAEFHLVPEAPEPWGS